MQSPWLWAFRSQYLWFTTAVHTVDGRMVCEILNAAFPTWLEFWLERPIVHFQPTPLASLNFWSSSAPSPKPLG
ncbi:hypothetical protein BD414DRAFT_116659 [Trametes punicea]|nr:hypothetical protein BD414DRAFT_116659 [Trametes punicea]